MSSNQNTRRSHKWNFINLDHLQEIAEGNDGFFIEMMEVFKIESVNCLQRMNDQFQKKDFFALSKTVHAMKPTGTYIGANSLTALMSRLERKISSGDDHEIGTLLNEVELLLKSVNNEIEEYLSSVIKN